MQLLQGDDFDQLFQIFKRRAFHLETQDSYALEEETESLRKFVAGEPEEDDPAWYERWNNLMCEATGSGKLVQRVRVVTEPHTDYTRWIFSTTDSNIAVGEDIRWLPRHLIDPNKLTTDDWWLFDDDLVAFTVFTPSGNLGGAAVTADPVIVEHCRSVRDRAWQLAIPHANYAISQPGSGIRQ